MSKAIINYDNFKILFSENLSKIYMTPETGSGKHQIIKERIQQWKQRLSELKKYSHEERSILLKFSEVVEHYLRYVTFDEFFGVIKKMAIEMFELIKKKNRVIFLIVDMPSKSNTWISLLFFGELLNLGVEKFKDKFLFIDDNHHALYTEVENTVAFFFDDMIYTGMQSLPIAERFRDLDGNNNFSGYMIVPFITKYAFERFRGYSCKFLRNTQVLDDLVTNVRTYFESEPETIEKIVTLCSHNPPYVKEKEEVWKSFVRSRNGLVCGRISSGQTAIYFDHKLPDEVSVLTEVQAHGRYPVNMNLANYKSKKNKNEEITFPEAGSLIANCNEANRKISCYKSFYKSYKLTYKGKELDYENTDNTIQQLYSIDLSIQPPMPVITTPMPVLTPIPTPVLTPKPMPAPTPIPTPTPMPVLTPVLTPTRPEYPNNNIKPPKKGVLGHLANCFGSLCRRRTKKGGRKNCKSKKNRRM